MRFRLKDTVRSLHISSGGIISRISEASKLVSRSKSKSIGLRDAEVEPSYSGIQMVVLAGFETTAVNNSPRSDVLG